VNLLLVGVNYGQRTMQFQLKMTPERIKGFSDDAEYCEKYSCHVLFQPEVPLLVLEKWLCDSLCSRYSNIFQQEVPLLV
jgi:hypothetical protein